VNIILPKSGIPRALPLTNRALDRPDQAQDTAESTIAFLSERQNIELLPMIQALQAELVLQ